MTCDFSEIPRATTSSTATNSSTAASSYTAASSSLNIIAMCTVFGAIAICVVAAIIVIVVRKKRKETGRFAHFLSCSYLYVVCFEHATNYRKHA